MGTSIFLLIAGMLDAVLTHLGVSFGLIEEGNPVIKLAIEKSWFLFYLIKVSLPLILIGIILFRPLKGWIHGLMRVSCVVYVAVLGAHIVWIAFYLKSVG
jgi:hypothetical protein